MNTTHAVVASLLAALAPLAQAGFAITDPVRIYGIGVTPGHEQLRTTTDAGYLRDSLFAKHTNPLGRTEVKLDYESLFQDNRYKSASLFQLEAQDQSPRHQATGGTAFLFSHLAFDQTTTIKIVYSVRDDSEQLDAAYILRLSSDSSDDVYLDERITDTQTRAITLTLAAGSYTLEDSTILGGLTTDHSGLWKFSTSLNISVVPAPAPLALLAPAGLFAARRRR